MDDKLAFHNDIQISHSGSAIIKFSSSKSFNPKPTTVKVESKNNVGKIVSWGGNNNRPGDLISLKQENGMLSSALSLLIKSHYGNGPTLIQETTTPAKEDGQPGKRVITPVGFLEHKQVYDFYKNSKLNLFFQGIITDLEYWSLAFPEYILSADYKKITKVCRQETAVCRFEVMDDNGKIPRIWISYKWEENPDLQSKYANSIPLIDMFMSAEEAKEYCKKNKIRNFVRAIHFPLLNEGYYPFTGWHASEKWIKLSNSIPDFKKAMFDNQANLSFLIEVSEDYFKRKYKDDWSETFTPDQQKEIRDEFAKQLDASITGQTNAGVNVHSVMYLDDNGKPESSVRITPIDNKFKEGMYLPEAAAANQEILAATGVDAPLIGGGGGGKLNSGGGDKRIAWTILQATMKSNREYTTDIFDFVKDWNNWPQNISLVFEDTNITTLDKNPTGTQNTVNS